MKKNILRRKLWHKLLIMSGLFLITSAACATIIVHTHTAIGHSVRDTAIPFAGKWRCKAEGPTNGTTQAMFQFLDRISGNVTANSGEAKCGPTVSVGLDWTFHTISDITSGTGVGRAWANEPAPPYCPNGDPNGPGNP